MTQRVQTLTQTVEAVDATRPLFIRTATPRANGTMTTDGSPAGGYHIEEYVQLSVLPVELKERVVTVIKALMQV